MTTPRKIKKGEFCEEPGCKDYATQIVFLREVEDFNSDAYPLPTTPSRIVVYCPTHGREALKIGSPEYTAVCPNCDCRIPVN